MTVRLCCIWKSGVLESADRELWRSGKEKKIMVLQEWKQLLKNKILLIVLIAIIAIPTIYDTIFRVNVGSIWQNRGFTGSDCQLR